MCTSPIWIANRRYTRKDHDISLPMNFSFQGHFSDVHESHLDS
nr:MAG TPA: hypothetical protein [Microviridae sp.]